MTRRRRSDVRGCQAGFGYLRMNNYRINNTGTTKIMITTTKTTTTKKSTKNNSNNKNNDIDFRLSLNRSLIGFRRCDICDIFSIFSIFAIFSIFSIFPISVLFHPPRKERERICTTAARSHHHHLCYRHHLFYCRHHPGDENYESDVLSGSIAEKIEFEIFRR